MTEAEVGIETAVAGPRECIFEGSIWSWANAYKISFAIFALNELGVLRLVATDYYRARQIADELGLDEALLKPLLELVASVGVLHREGDRFRAPQGIEITLPLLAMEGRLSASHITASQVANVVRTGKGADVFHSLDASEYIPIFTIAMRSNARTLAPYLVRFGKLRQCRRVLDLGGADGSLALALLRLVPHLSIEVIDLPRMGAAFEQNMKENGASSTIQFDVSDLRNPETLARRLETYDVIVISNVVHLLTTSQRIALYREIRRHGLNGGTLIVYDQFIDYDSPINATHCMSVDWIVNGVQFRETPEECAEILEAHGFYEVRHSRFRGLPGAIVVARL